MNLPEETGNNQPAGRKTGVFMAVLLFLAIISVAFFTYLNSQNIDIRAVSFGQFSVGINDGQVKTSETLYDIPFDPRERPAFSVYKDFLVKYGKDGVRLLDKKGAEVFSQSMPLGKPLAKTNGKDLLIADIGGQDVYVLKEDGIVWKDKLDVGIINADISREGFVTIVTGSKRYNGEVRVYDSRGIELFRSIIASDFAISAKVSPSSGQMAVDSIDTAGVKAATGIRFYDLDGADLGEKNLEASDSIFSSILYADTGELFAVGDRSILAFDKDRNIQWEKKFKAVTGACITGGKRLAAVVEDDGGTKLAVYSAAGKELAVYAVGGARSVSAGSGIIAASTLRDVSFYNEKLRIIGKYTSKSDITDVYFFNRQQAAVVTKNQVSIISIG